MIGQPIIDVTAEARGRYPTFFAGAFYTYMIIVMGDCAKQLPISDIGRADSRLN